MIRARPPNTGNRFAKAYTTCWLVILHGQLWYGRGSLPNVSSLAQELDTSRNTIYRKMKRLSIGTVNRDRSEA